MKDEKVIDSKVVEGTAVEVTKDVAETKVGLVAKTKSRVKKHGKKLLVGTLIALAGGIGYTLGSKKSKNSGSDNGYDDYYDNDNDTEDTGSVE